MLKLTIKSETYSLNIIIMVLQLIDGRISSNHLQLLLIKFTSLSSLFTITGAKGEIILQNTKYK